MSTKDQNQGRDKEQMSSEDQEGRGISSENRGLGSQDNDLQQVVSGAAQQSSFAEETEEKDIDEDLQTERSRPKNNRNNVDSSRNNNSSGEDRDSSYGEEEGSPSGRKSGDLDIKKDRSL